MHENRPNPYLDDILHSKGLTFEQHVTILVTVLEKLRDGGMQVNALKSLFGQIKVEFLGFMLLQKGYRPLQNCADTIL